MRKGRLKFLALIFLAAVLMFCLFAFVSCKKHVHVFVVWEEINAPTCTEEGLEKSICECGEEEKRIVASVGHIPSERIILTKVDCIHDGSYKIECLNCGELLENGKIASVGHSIVSQDAKEANCSSVGWSKYEFCENCDYSTYKEIPKTAHLSSGKADCVTRESCSVCGEILREAIGHTEKTVIGRKSTCSRNGLSDGIICSVCDVVIVKQMSVPKTEHTPEQIIGKAATCTDTGKSDGVRCSECQAVIVQPIEIPQRGHKYSGTFDTECDLCGFNRPPVDKSCIHENQITLKKIPSTCSRYGLTQGVICDDCGETLIKQEVIVAKEHISKTAKAYDATCVLPGVTEGSECSECGIVLKHQEIIMPTGHVEIADSALSPTCGSEGLTEGRHCAVCQEIIVKQNIIEPSGHIKIAHNGKAATCVESGWSPYYTCAVCSYTSFERLERGGHVEIIDEAVAAACEKDGLTSGKHCSLCGAVTKKQEALKALGHLFGTWKRVKAGGCTDEESLVRVCERCFCVEGKNGADSHEFNAVCQIISCTQKRELFVICTKCNADGGKQSISPLGHDLVWSITSDGHSQRCDRGDCGYSTSETAHRGGNNVKCEDKSCLDCGHVISAGIGHTMGTRYDSDSKYHWYECVNIGCDYTENKMPHTNSSAKCTDRSVKCTDCGRYYSPDVNHSMGEWEKSKTASCTVGGTMTRKCEKCSYSETKEIEKTAHVMGAWYSVSSTQKRRDCGNCDYYETKTE